MAFTIQPLAFTTLVVLALYGPLVFWLDETGSLFRAISANAGLIGLTYVGLLILNWFYLLGMGI